MLAASCLEDLVRGLLFYVDGLSGCGRCVCLGGQGTLVGELNFDKLLVNVDEFPQGSDKAVVELGLKDVGRVDAESLRHGFAREFTKSFQTKRIHKH